MKQYKVTPIGTKDRSPVFCTWLQLARITATVYPLPINTYDTETGFIVTSKGVDVLEVEEVEEIFAGALPA
jgi:hypothetical protein